MIIKYNDLKKIREKNNSKEIAICTGTFDLFHYSHLMFLKYIKNHCDILVVVVKSDKDVKKKGNNRPIVNEYERSMIVDSIKYTDYTIISNEIHETKIIKDLIESNNYDEKDKYRLLRDGSIFEELQVNTLYVTEDKKPSKVMSDLSKKINMKIKTIPIQGNGFHTTDIIDKIKKS